MPPPDWLLKSSRKQHKQRTGTGIALNHGAPWCPLLFRVVPHLKVTRCKIWGITSVL